VKLCPQFTQSITLAIIIVLLIGGISYAAPLSSAISEDFKNSTAPGWTLYGHAVLTGNGVIDPAGDGWLRLTSNSNYQAGSALYNTAFSSTEGVNIEFDYATYGGNGADGFTFYLIDGATVTPTLGSSGGSLGYSWDSYQKNPGVTNGYVGIGFDEHGNFATTSFGSCTDGCPSRVANQVIIRGSGSLYGSNYSTGFNYLTRAAAVIGTTNRAGAKKVRINITPAPTVEITVQVDHGSGFVTIIDSYDLTSASGQVAIPDTFKMGFSGSTGGLNNYHEIRNLEVIEEADTGDGPPSASVSVPVDGAVLTTGPSQLEVTFDEGISLATATNVDNYILLEAKGDGGYESGDCDDILYGTGVAITDTRITILNAAYPTTKWTSTLALGSALPVGTYRLLVCGTTSIEDLAGNELNDGLSDAHFNFTVKETPTALPLTGFPIGRAAYLMTQPENKAYTETAMMLEIPSLGVEAPIVGVPISDEGWNLTWLGDQAGWLQSTAFPSWAGNSAITAHVYDADGQPGLFNKLSELKWGDEVIVTAYGQAYVYEVHTVEKYVRPDDISSVFEHEDYPWLTLITCKGYDEKSDSYRWRVVVRAVQTRID